MGPPSRYPLDSAGLVLPEPSWPDEPGSAGVLEPLRRFCNTTNRENGADAWRTTGQLAEWLDREGYGPVDAIDQASLARLLALRDALWQGICTDGFDAFARVAGTLSVRVGTTDSGVALVAGGSPVDGIVARLVLAACEGATTGVLDRLKCCRHCRWVFHDTSKNRSGRWCSMGACGSRSKARAYRRRHVAEGAP
jgi:hypothetical protein